MENRVMKIFLLLCVTLFSSCEKEHLGDCFKSTVLFATSSSGLGNTVVISGGRVFVVRVANFDSRGF